jgi:KUP system potassium uptake protein
MVDWHVGRVTLSQRLAEASPPISEFLQRLDAKDIVRIPGTAIFLSSNPNATPVVLSIQARRMRALREHLLLLTVQTEHVPRVDEKERTAVEDLGRGVFRVIIRSGFMERPDIPSILARANLPVDLHDATYFLGRETFVVGKGGRMGVFSEGLFAFLSRNAKTPTSWFSIPPEQVIEVGMQMDL